MKTNKIIKEQQDTEAQSNAVKNRLTVYIDRGCAPNGKLVKMTSTNPELSFAIRQESTKTEGKFRYLYDIKKNETTFEKKIAVPGAGGKLVFSGTWYCDVDLKYTEPTNFERQKKEDMRRSAIEKYKLEGWIDMGGVLNPAEIEMYKGASKIDLKDKHPEAFVDSYILVNPNLNSIKTDELIRELTELVKTRNYSDRKTCRQIINNYNVAKQKNVPINDAVLLRWKSAVNMCDSEVKNFNDLGITKKTLETLKADTQNQRWSLTVTPKKTTVTSVETSGTPTDNSAESPSETNENYLKLKKIIRENLNELSESKKKSLVEEYKIINSRFNVISESGKPKTKKQEVKLVDDLITEIFYLKSQGFNETLINEQFLDIIKGLFGQIPGGILDTLKERIAQFILKKLGVGTDGYLANIVIATLGNIPVSDYVNGKIFRCDYLSNAIAKGVGEGIVRKIQKEKGMEGYMYDIIRNSLVEMFTDSSFGQKIEDMVSKLVCPGIDTVKNKMEIAGQTMKEKALS